MEYTYPLLTKIIESLKPNIDLSDYYLVCCQHILGPQKKMFESFIELGFDPQKIIILGKIYSTNTEVLKELEQRQVKIRQPEFSNGIFDIEHRNNCLNLLDTIPADAKCILLDDGGELIKVFSDAKRNIIFAVEQTSSGYGKLLDEEFNFPVVNVARSTTKLTQESPLVARHAVSRINDYLDKKGLINPLVLVVGLGPIGEAVSEVILESNYEVKGYDIKHGHTDLLQTINNYEPDVVIGATGNNILNKEDIQKFITERKLYLISVSSSDREFPVSTFRAKQGIHDDVLYNNIIFVNNGFPISFKGNRFELTALEFEKTLCLLTGSILYGLTKTYTGKGLINVPKELEDLINKD